MQTCFTLEAALIFSPFHQPTAFLQAVNSIACLDSVSIRSLMSKAFRFHTIEPIIHSSPVLSFKMQSKQFHITVKDTQ